MIVTALTGDFRGRGNESVNRGFQTVTKIEAILLGFCFQLLRLAPQLEI